MSRVRLPDRRRADTRAFDGMRFTVTIGFYNDGRPGEVFAHGARAGSMMDGILDDACVAIIGAVVDLLAGAEARP